MNCRPGDLALVRSPGLRMQCVCGHYVVCVKPGTPVVCKEFVGRYWRIEETLHFDVTGPCGARAVGSTDGVADEMLRPIRDPGDDAVDQVVQRLGAAPKVDMPREVVHG